MNNYNQQYPFDNYKVVGSEATTAPAVSNKFIANVFLWMFAALGVSAICAFLFATSPGLMSSLIDTGSRRGLSTLGWAVMFAPIGFVMLMSFGYSRLSAPALTGLFLVYAAITGISLSFILLIYTSASVLGCFVASSAMFGIMAVMGYTTNKDLTSFGRLMMMGLIGILIAMIANMFLRSDTMGYLISIIGVMVFTGLTAYDVQKLKRIGAGIENSDISAGDTKKASVFGALTLYLDFINLFLMMLRLFGRRRN